jgi:hypothetical protein
MLSTKQPEIAPTVENRPARLASTTTTAMIFALGATKLYVKQKVTTTTKVIAETATKFRPLLGFTTFLTNLRKHPIKVVATTSGPAPAPVLLMVYTDGATTSVFTVVLFYQMLKI